MRSGTSRNTPATRARRAAEARGSRQEETDLAEGRRVVVTGLGVISSIGQDVETYWKSLLAGKSGVRPIAGFDSTGFTCQIAGEVRDFDPLRWLDQRTAGPDGPLHADGPRRRDAGGEGCRAGLREGRPRAVRRHHRHRHRRPDRDRGAAQAAARKRPDRVSPFLVPKLMANACAGQVSIHYGLHGPNLCADDRLRLQQPLHRHRLHHHPVRRRRRDDHRRQRGRHHAAGHGRVLLRQGALDAQRRAGEGLAPVRQGPRRIRDGRRRRDRRPRRARARPQARRAHLRRVPRLRHVRRRHAHRRAGSRPAAARPAP